MNRVILIGRLTKDVDLRYSQSGVAVGRLTLAVDRRQAAGQEKEADFIDVVTFKKTAENCANFIGKGRLCAIEGRLQIRSYDGNDGVRRKAAEVLADNVQFLDKPKDSDSGQQSQQQHGYGDVGFDENDPPF